MKMMCVCEGMACKVNGVKRQVDRNSAELSVAVISNSDYFYQISKYLTPRPLHSHKKRTSTIFDALASCLSSEEPPGSKETKNKGKSEKRTLIHTLKVISQRINTLAKNKQNKRKPPAI
jgi:hypothetical protein